MKRLSAGFGIFLVILMVSLFHKDQKSTITSSVGKEKNTPSSIGMQQEMTTLFVPYWTMNGEAVPTNYNQVAYFGIAVNTNGIDTQEDGYKDLATFVASVHQNQRTLLTVRLLDQNVDEKILHDSTFQQKIIQESANIAKEYKFDGIVLDLEYRALAFDEVVQGITSFSTDFAHTARNEHLAFYQALYGDTFYRLRPFDAGAIGKVADGIFVMAYDFHKANGNPGPNFPLHQLPDEQYSFEQMVHDFTEKIPPDKLTIVFGLFGYDWTVDGNGQAIGEAESLTTTQMLQKFIAPCNFKNCMVSQNKAHETKITYQDASAQNHIVWFEDLASIDLKERLLTAEGVYSTAFWAYSYF